MKTPTIANASVGEVGMIEQLSNLLSQAAPDEAHQNKKPTNAKAMVGEVGTTGFEPATPCTPCKCATGLRYVPKQKIEKVRHRSLYCCSVSPYVGCKSMKNQALKDNPARFKASRSLGI